MRTSTKKTLASAVGIAIVLSSTAMVRLWAAPQFVLNVKTQVIIVAATIAIVKAVYFLAVELHEQSEVDNSAATPDAAPNSN
jgi:hypothetical protein